MSDEKTPRPDPSDIKPVSILDEMKRSYLDYAMSVIVSRALPDVRDGLKPVHRRILFGMHEHNFTPDRPYNKSARTVGDVIGKYHPHGDLAVYDALVRMAQDFSMRAPLIDGQGNFGSVDGDPPAAMRYTESRLEKIAMAMLDDLDKDTVDFTPQLRREGDEPTVLPSRVPNLHRQRRRRHRGRHGDQHPPAQSRRDDRRRARDDGAARHVGRGSDGDHSWPGLPDRRQSSSDAPASAPPTRRDAARSSCAPRSISRTMRKDREAIIVTEIPYQVNKAALVERIAELVREKRIEGISDLRDESDRDGMRVVIELKRDAVADVVLNQLYRFTAMQTSFGGNMIALNGGKPEMMTLRDMLRAFLEFREKVVTRRTKYLLNKARDGRISRLASPSPSPISTR